MKHAAPSGPLSKGGRRHDLVEPNQHLEVTAAKVSRMITGSGATGHNAQFVSANSALVASLSLYFMFIKWKCGPLPERPLG